MQRGLLPSEGRTSLQQSVSKTSQKSIKAAANASSASWSFGVSFLLLHVSFPLSPLAYLVLNCQKKKIVNIHEITTFFKKLRMKF